MFHAGRLPTKKRHNAETNSPVQPMGTYRRRVFLESIYGKSFSCRNGRKSSYSRASAVSAMGKHERRWNISPDGTITRSNVILTAKRLSSAENRGLFQNRLWMQYFEDTRLSFLLRQRKLKSFKKVLKSLLIVGPDINVTNWQVDRRASCRERV